MNFQKLATLSLLFCLIVISNTMQAQGDAFSITYEKFTLDNGLEVILHEDHSDPIVAVATMMHVGSSREKPGKTGFAHFFEHMSFNDSENVPVGANRKMIPEWGGSRNGGTWSDGTVYYEVVPKDAFEKILWIDSDRFGYMINTVTEAALEREKQVVKNEKRQRVDNRPYGYTNEILRKNMYPEGHPYSWTVIGQLPDLQAATIDDVKEFYKKYYGASNASLVIAGDINIAETKVLVEKWFGEIPSGPKVEAISPMPVTLAETKSLYFEDNFAKLPELRMVFPTVEEYNKDVYALQVLGQLLSSSKTAPLYQVLVEEEKLAPAVYTYQNSSELTGEFTFNIRANAQIDLDAVKAAVEKGLARFESSGVNDKDLKRIKAELETGLYQGFSTVLNKAFQLVQDNEFKGDPGYISKTAALTNAVTEADVMRVYKQYIKDKNYVMTSVVPKEAAALAVEGSSLAEVWIEEVKQGVADEEVSQGEEAVYEKTTSKYDRSEPAFGETPLFKSPEIWETTLANGMKVLGIENKEVPVVQFSISIPGGHLLDPKGKAGVASLLSDLMMQGTASKTAAELEEAIGLLGASIDVYSRYEDFHIAGSCLSKNLASVMKLVEEIMLEPRWDTAEYERLMQALETNLKGQEANPDAIADNNFYKLLYGPDHIFSRPGKGTFESIKNISMADLKAYYGKLSSENSTLHIAGSTTKEEVDKIVAALSNKWNVKAPNMPVYKLPETPKKDHIYFIDVPDAKQSILYVGKLALSRSSADYNKLNYANEILGGGSSGKLFQTLRIEKGYTYGAYSSITQLKEVAPFFVRTSVRANATLASLEIIKDMLNGYEASFDEDAVTLTQNKIVKRNTRAFESLNAKLGILRTMSKYKLPMNYLDENQKELMNMNLSDFKNMINNYLDEKEMVYVIVADKAMQYEEVKKLGKEITELDIHGNVVE